MPETARAFWTVEAGRGEIRSEPLPEPGPGQALVEALHSGISRGSELLVYGGQVPDSEYERMRAPHQAGGFPFPVKYGYCSVGRVRAGAAELIGREVFCLYPHQSAYVVDERALVPLPRDVPPHRAVLAANMETALNAVWDGELAAGQRVAVVGAGTVGVLVAYLAARHPGCEVELADIDPCKAEIARAVGARFVSVAAARPDADVVFHASGAPEGLETALALAGREANVVELSWYGSARVSLPLGGPFHALRLRLQSSQVGSVAARQRARFSTRRRLELALRLVADSALDRLIDAHGRFEDLPAIMASLASGEQQALCFRVDYA